MKISFTLINILFLLLIFICCSSTNQENIYENFIENNNIENEEVDTSLTEEELENDINDIKVKTDENKVNLLNTYTEEEQHIVNTYFKINEILKQEDTDYIKIQNLYDESKVQEKAKELDKIYKTSTHYRILKLIELGIREYEYIESKLFIEFIFLFKNALLYEFNKVLKKEIITDNTSLGASNNWDKAYVYYKVFKPLIEEINNYPDIDNTYEKEISNDYIEKHFIKGADYIKDFTNEKLIQIYIEIQRIEKKIIQILFINMLKNIDHILKLIDEGDYSNNITEYINLSKGYFKIFSYGIGNKEVKTLISKELGKTYQLKKEIILSNAILYIFYYEMNEKLSESLKVYTEINDNSMEDKRQKLIWKAYFYYTVFKFDFINKMGEEKTKELKDKWAYLITITKQNPAYSDLTKSIQSLQNTFADYIRLLKKSIS